MFEIDITVSPHHGGAEYNWSSIVITADLGFAELTSSTGYLDAPLRQFNWGASPGVGILFDVPIETTTQEVRPVSTRDSPLQWIAGVCYHDAVSDVFGIVDIDFVGFQSTYLSATPRTSKALSIYGEVSYKIHDQWTVLAGLSRKDDDRVAIKIQDNCDPDVDPIGGVLLLARIGDSDAALDGIWRKVPCDERRARASWHGHAAESLYLSHLVYARPLNGACLCDDRANADRLTARTSNVDPSRTSRLKILARGAILLGALFLQELSADSRKLEYRHGFSLVNEQRYPPDFTHFEYLNPNAPKGGTLVLSTSLDINNFSDEWDNTVAVAPGLTQTYDFLLTRADDELSGYYGSLAEGVAVADDLLSIAFRLRPEARWHDGTPITAQDVKFTYDFAKGTMDGQLFLDWLDSVEVLGQHEVLFKLSTRLTTANLALFGYGRILPAHYWKGRNPSETTMDVPLGSGPYRIAEFQQGRFIRYERVCDYWGKDLPVNRGRFNFDEIRFEVYRDSTMAREGLRKGLVDAFVEGDIGHWASSYNVPSRDKGWLVLAEAANGIFVGPAAVVAFNLRHAPFDDPVVREALALALDYKWLNRVLNHGLYEQPRSYFANSVFASSPDYS